MSDAMATMRNHSTAGNGATAQADSQNATPCHAQSTPRVRIADGQRKPAEREQTAKDGTPAVASMLDRGTAGERVKTIRRPARAATGQFTPVAKALKVCVVCGAEFVRRAKNDRPNICCSRACGFKYLGNIKRAKNLKPVRAVEPRLINHPRAMKVKVCKVCGFAFIRPYGATGSYEFCGNECAEKALKDIRRKSRRIQRMKGGSPSTHRKRAKKYGCSIGRVDRIKLFNDSKWTCCCCGVSTPREAMGKQQPNSPELDHIIPLSKGGAHDQSNVQLLCRVCNCAKGATVNARNAA